MRMLILTNLNTLDQDEYTYRRKVLRNAVICIGWLKLISVIYYVILYFLIHANSKGYLSDVLQIMTLVTIIPQILEGVLLFMGALEGIVIAQELALWFCLIVVSYNTGIVIALELALWLCLIVASYNTVLGVMGAIYFIRSGHLTMHFILAVIFGLLALSLYAVICHDIIMIYAYKQMLVMRDSD